MYIRIGNTLPFRFLNVVTDSGDPKCPILVTRFWHIPTTNFGTLAQIVILADIVFSSLALETFTCIPLVRLNSDPENIVGRELFLSQVGRLPKFIIFPVHKIIKVGLNELGVREIGGIGLRGHHLLHLIVDDILSYFAEPEIGGINFPVIWPFLLLSGIVVQMRLEVHLADVLLLRHVLPRVDGLLDIVLIFLGGQPILELIINLIGKIVLAIDGVAQWFPLQ